MNKKDITRLLEKVTDVAYGENHINMRSTKKWNKLFDEMKYHLERPLQEMFQQVYDDGVVAADGWR